MLNARTHLCIKDCIVYQSAMHGFITNLLAYINIMIEINVTKVLYDWTISLPYQQQYNLRENQGTIMADELASWVLYRGLVTVWPKPKTILSVTDTSQRASANSACCLTEKNSTLRIQPSALIWSEQTSPHQKTICSCLNITDQIRNWR